MFVIISRIIGILFWVAEKFFDLFAWIPFAGLIDRILGAIFGFIEGFLAVTIILYFATKHISDEVLVPVIGESFFAKILQALISAIQVLFFSS